MQPSMQHGFSGYFLYNMYLLIVSGAQHQLLAPSCLSGDKSAGYSPQSLSSFSSSFKLLSSVACTCKAREVSGRSYLEVKRQLKVPTSCDELYSCGLGILEVSGTQWAADNTKIINKRRASEKEDGFKV